MKFKLRDIVILSEVGKREPATPDNPHDSAGIVCCVSGGDTIKVLWTDSNEYNYYTEEELELKDGYVPEVTVTKSKAQLYSEAAENPPAFSGWEGAIYVKTGPELVLWDQFLREEDAIALGKWILETFGTGGSK